MDRGKCVIPLFCMFVCVVLPHGKVLLLNRSSLAQLSHLLSAKVSAQRASSLGIVKQLHLSPQSSITASTTAASLVNTISLFTVQTLTFLCLLSCTTCFCLFSITSRADPLLIPAGALLKQRIWIGARLLEDTVGARL